MELAKAGFPRWITWAWFSWDGKINRLPYFGASFLSTFPIAFCIFFIFWGYARLAYGAEFASQIMEPELFLEYVSTNNVPYLLTFPLIYVTIVLDAKRLRSIGMSPYFSVGLHIVHFFSPTTGPVSIAMTFIMLGYYLILLCTPPKKMEAGGSMDFSDPERNRERGDWPSGAGTRGGFGAADNSGFGARPVQDDFDAADSASRRQEAAPEKRSVRIRDWRVLAPAPRREEKGK